MAIYHCSMTPIARAGGRSAVAAAAYRTASMLVNERDGLVHDFTRKKGVEHSEIVLPEGVEADWAQDRATLWNAVERAEKRKDARIAREIELALPHDLTRDQQIALTRAFAQELADRYGAAVDFAIHRPTGDTDVRNVHAHMLMTTRTVEAHGLGEKTLIERENKWLLNHNQPTSHMQLLDIRRAWENHANRELMRAGLDIRIDHRGHLERGLKIEPTDHVGVHASQMDRRGLGVTRVRNEAQAAVRNAGLIRGNPEQVLTLITGEKSVFDRHDVARALHRYIDDVQEFKTAFAAVMTSPALLELRPEQNGKLARYSTREMVQIEHALASRASKMGGTKSHGVDNRNVASVLARQDDTIKASIAASLQGHANSGELLPPQQRQQIESGGLSQEQRAAVMHITGPEQIAAVVGFAGAGKSTMLAAAREAWERQGYRVHGAALAGKAAAGLEESSGIASRTLASWAYGWQRGSGELSANDIFVIDEAGMVGSRQLAILVAEVEAKGAKLVLVGDHEQLQAIGAGSPFRALVEQVGAVELSEIRRQKQDWQREASTAFATHRTDEGLASYASNGDVRFLSDPDAARRDLVKDYLEDLDQRSKGSRIALAHRRADVRAINADIRNALQDEGKLARGDGEGKAEQDDAKLGRERIYRTNDGERAFAPGDRIVLLENNRDLGVKNGMLGQVMGVEPDVIQIRLDGAGRDQSQNVYIPIKSYQAFDHGYATTIHKSQGSTVDRAFVMASATMDRHLTYVAMTRHRDRVRLYVSQNELKDMKALAVSVGRSGAKETTLDYTRAFAERRGLAEELGIRSEITVSINSTKDRNLAHYGAMEERVRVPADPRPLEQSWVPTSEGLGSPAKKVPPLIPARTRYDRTVEEVARSKALPHLERAMDPIRSVGVYVYADPGAVAAVIGKAITAKGSDGFALAKLVAEQPEQLGQLRGKQGLLGESKERKAARHFAKPLSHHIRSAADTWERRLEAERDSERWMREKQDVVEVPGLRTRSEEILRQLDRTPQAQKDAVLDRILSTPEGRQALEEAADIAEALTQRFGTSDPRVFKSLTELFGTRLLHGAEKAGEVAGLVHRAHNQECSRQYRLEESLRRGRGIRLEL